MFQTSFGRNVRRDSHSRLLVQVDSQPTATTPALSGGSLTGRCRTCVILGCVAKMFSSSFRKDSRVTRREHKTMFLSE